MSQDSPSNPQENDVPDPQFAETAGAETLGAERASGERASGETAAHDVDEGVIRAFEEAWLSGSPRSIEEVVGGSELKQRRGTLEELCHIELEFAWKQPIAETADAAARPNVEDYLARFPELATDETVGRLAEQEWQVRADVGEAPTKAEYQRRFPDLSTAHWRTTPESPAKPSAPGLPQIEGYRIVEPLGSGGMGVVYLAEQEHPKRTVALKLVRRDLTSPEALRRLEQEAFVLGRLNHPGIAQIFEAGIADAGGGATAYIAMEHVQGSTLLEHVKRNTLSLRRRVELIADVCDAVQHAHQLGVIHRDLKPGNILVDESGDVGAPKVLDFGIARLTDADFETTLKTQTGQIIGTLQYMSPEQATGDPHALDTRSDIYSLGLILYQLLVDQLPYDLERLPLAEALRRIRDEEPTPLGSVRRELRGDLATVVGKALAKEKDRRYATAAAFADDLRSYLDDKPILARPPSALYHFSKFARRHRAVVAGATVAILALVVASIVATRQAIIATNALEEVRLQKEQTEREAANVRAVNDFLTHDVLDLISPWRTGSLAALGRDPELKDLLVTATERLDGRFPEEGEIEADIRLALGRGFAGLGDYKAALPEHTRALALLEAEFGRDAEITLQARYEFASLMNLLGHYKESSEQLIELIATCREKLGSEHPLTLRCLNAQGYLYWFLARYPEALEVLDEAYTGRVRVFGAESPEALETKFNLGNVYKSNGEFPVAEEYYLEILKVREEQLVPDDPHLVTLLNNLSNLYSEWGRLEESLPIQERVVAAARRTLGDDHPSTCIYMTNLARKYMKQERFHDAELLMKEAWEARRRVLGEKHPWTLSSYENLGELYVTRGDPEQGEPLLRTAVERGREVLTENRWYLGVFLRKYAICLRKLGQLDGAEKALLEAYDVLSETVGKQHRHTLPTIRTLIELYLQQGRDEEVDKWRKRLPEAE